MGDINRPKKVSLSTSLTRLMGLSGKNSIRVLTAINSDFASALTSKETKPAKKASVTLGL